MLDSIHKKPSDLIKDLINTNSALKQLNIDYTDKTRGEVYLKRMTYLRNKKTLTNRKLREFGADEIIQWFVKVNYINNPSNSPTDFMFRISARYSQKEVSTLIAYRYDCMVIKIEPYDKFLISSRIFKK